MRRLRSIAALLAAGAGACALALPAHSETRTVDTSYTSHALGGRLHYEVYLPPDYYSSGLRYPVVYFLHGLPASDTSYLSARFVERALDRVSRAAILVVPQGARAGETDPEYVNHGSGDNWGDAISLELPRVVDSRFRTIPNRDGRALIGLSAGGYGAMHLALKHLSMFSVVESWSGYFHPTDPTGTKPLSLGSPDRDAKADVHAAARRDESKLALTEDLHRLLRRTAGLAFRRRERAAESRAVTAPACPTSSASTPAATIRGSGRVTHPHGSSSRSRTSRRPTEGTPGRSTIPTWRRPPSPPASTRATSSPRCPARRGGARDPGHRPPVRARADRAGGRRVVRAGDPAARARRRDRTARPLRHAPGRLRPARVRARSPTG